MKTPEEILKSKSRKEFCEYNEPFYSESVVIAAIHEYADQFRKPPKKTIEERKRQFEINLKEVIGQPVCYDQLTIDFFEYWTEHSEGAKKMRFEKEKVFDIKKRLDRWKRNQKQSHGARKPDTESAMQDFLSR